MWAVWQVSCVPSYIPSGDQIYITVSLDDGTIPYLTTVGEEFVTTNTVANAQAFIIDSGTGYVFFPSTNTAAYSLGYGLPTVGNSSSYAPVDSVDGSYYVCDNPGGEYGIKCEYSRFQAREPQKTPMSRKIAR